MSSKKSAGKGSSAPLQPPQEEKKPIAKGHRQRGAGTVVTAKPALVTKDGITLKPHEKLPFQLLHEYCQRNKRPSPKYNRAPKTAADRGLDEETFRVRVILEDAKNAKNNLSFCPVQAFSSELIAKDYAALLALFHLQRTIPLERTLPQPYSTVWLQLVSGNSESLSEAKEDDIQDDPNAVSINSTASVETITTVVIDEEQADWLCSQCGMPNTFLTLAKNVRKKCFKCQAVKDESAIAVGSSTKSAKINTSTVSGSAKVVKKIPPPVVLNLQATEQFASTAAQEQFEMQAKSNKNAILSYADAVWKTNPYYSLDGISAALADHVSKLVGFARPTKSTLPSSPPVAKSAVDTYVLSDFESDIERRLRQYGWEMSNKRCLHGVIDGALESVKRFPLPIEDQLTTLLVVLVSHYLLAQSIVDDEDVRNMLASSVATLLSSSTASGVRDSSVVEEEETMLAIYGTDVMDTFHVETELGYVHRVSMTYNSYSLHLFYSSTLPYPHTYPLIYLTGSNPTVSNKLVSMNSQLYKKMLSCSLGSPILFDLYAHLADIEDIEGSSMAIESDRVGAVLCTHCTAFGIAYNSDKMPTETSSTKEVKRLTISQANPVLEMQSRSFKKPRVKSVHPYWIRTSTASSYEVIFPVSTAQYQVMFRQRQGLPASRKRDLFIGMIQTKQVVIVTGETGCGKTTQIPQYLVEARGYCKVLVCQPRRLAAIGVAQRIADETSTSIGEQVGYMVKGEVKASRNTQILFCTYGVLLRVLQDDPMLQSVDYIILDEVHERGMDSDFSLALLMHALKRRGDSLKLVLMSATISTEQFQTYLCRELYDGQNPSEMIPIMHIEGFTFPVQDVYKNEFEEYVRSRSISASEEVSFPRKVKDVDFELLVKLLIVLLTNPDNKTEDIYQPIQGCVLIFLPGISEISRMIRYISACFSSSPRVSRLVLLPLHSNLSPSEQAKVFVTYKDPTVVKIICATNIAEASVTIPDVTVVIDSCKVKAMYYDVNTQSNTLLTAMAGRFNLVQRKGRAGRVRAGRCYKLITQHTYENIIQQQMPPEILRISLDSIILQCYAMKEVFMQQSRKAGDSSVFTSADILSKCIDCPSKESIVLTEHKLALLQAIDLEQAELTHLGTWLSNLACSPQIGRLLVYGVIMKCVTDACLVASIITCKSPFVSFNPHTNNASEEDKKNKEKVGGAMTKYGGEEGKLISDFEMLLKVVIAFQRSPQPRKFCQLNGLVYERMSDIFASKDDFLKDLQDAGLLVSRRSNECDVYSLSSSDSSVPEDQRARVVNAVIAAGLFPNVALVVRPPKRFIEIKHGKVEKDMTPDEMKHFIPTYEVATTTIASPPSSKGPIEDTTDKDLRILFDQGFSSPVQKVDLPGSTLNARNNKYDPSSYLIYAETFRTGSSTSAQASISLQMTAEVMPIPLVLFAWNKQTRYDEQTGLLYINDYIRFCCGRDVYALLLAVQQAMDEALFLPPEELAEETVSKKRRDLLDAMLALVVTEGTTFKKV